MGNDSPAPNELLEAVPNFSEGRSRQTLRHLVEAAGRPAPRPARGPFPPSLGPHSRRKRLGTAILRAFPLRDRHPPHRPAAPPGRAPAHRRPRCPPDRPAGRNHHGAGGAPRRLAGRRNRRRPVGPRLPLRGSRARPPHPCRRFDEAASAASRTASPGGRFVPTTAPRRCTRRPGASPSVRGRRSSPSTSTSTLPTRESRGPSPDGSEPAREVFPRSGLSGCGRPIPRAAGSSLRSR